MCRHVQAWWYRKWVWDWIDSERIAELHAAVKPTIAFHIRGGDVAQADKAQARLLTLANANMKFKLN